MNNQRIVRVAQVIRSELSRMASAERTLEGDLLSFTHVEITKDLHYAYVYCSTLNEHLQEDEMISKLNALRPKWQTLINSRMRIKYTPKLVFKADQTQQRANRIDDILDSLEIQSGNEGD